MSDCLPEHTPTVGDPPVRVTDHMVADVELPIHLAASLTRGARLSTDGERLR